MTIRCEPVPSGDTPAVAAYIDKYLWLAHSRLPQFAAGTTPWWLELRPFFGGLQRERIWIFWRRVLHTAHHRTQLTVYLRLLGKKVPSTYGPTADVTWEGADPTQTVRAASRK